MLQNILKVFFSSLLAGSLLGFIYMNIIVIPEQHIGLLDEKTKGLASHPLEPGYHWIWTGFVPLKWKLHLIDISPSSLNIAYRAPLKYSEYLELPNIFDFQLELRLSYSIDKTKILALRSSLDKSDGELLKYIEERIYTILELKYFEIYRTETDIPLIKPRITNYLQQPEGGGGASFRSDFKKLFESSGIILNHLDIVKIYVPDYQLYRVQLRNIPSLAEARRQLILKNIDAKAEIFAVRLKNKLELEKTKEILQLIAQEPRILEYLKYQELNSKTKVIQIESHGKMNQLYNRYPLQSKTGKEESQNQIPLEGFAENKEGEEETGYLSPIVR